MTQSPIESLKRDDIRRLQIERLQMTLNRAYFNVEFYRSRMDALDVLPEDFATLEDFSRFPFTTREDLANHYPYGLFAEPLKSIVRLKITAPLLRDGSNPVVVGFTRHDTAMWNDLTVRLFRRLGVNERDIVQVAFNYSLFPGAFTFNAAAESIGATLAPSATSSATLQLQVMQDFLSTVFTTSADFALHIAETIKRMRIDPEGLHLRVILLGPDPLPEAARDYLQSVFKAPVYGLYGLTEMVEPGVAGECFARDGLHIAEDQFMAEIVHPGSGEHVSPGQPGELVITTLTAEAYPLIRYRTGDVTVFRDAPCSCGRSSGRIAPILRRTDNRFSVRGIPIYPEQVESILKRIDPDLQDFRLVVETILGISDQMELLLARPSDNDFPEKSRSQYLDMVRSNIRRVFGVGARVQLIDSLRMPKEGMIYKTVFRNASPESCPFAAGGEVQS